jgi:hypothetical protein
VISQNEILKHTFPKLNLAIEALPKMTIGEESALRHGMVLISNLLRPLTDEQFHKLQEAVYRDKYDEIMWQSVKHSMNPRTPE